LRTPRRAWRNWSWTVSSNCKSGSLHGNEGSCSFQEQRTSRSFQLLTHVVQYIFSFNDRRCRTGWSVEP
jgi:hypothetical protein